MYTKNSNSSKSNNLRSMTENIAKVKCFHCKTKGGKIVKLKLSSRFVFQLNDVLYLPGMKRNLGSSSKLVKQGFVFLGDDACVKFFQNGSLDLVLGKACLNDDLMKIS